MGNTSNRGGDGSMTGSIVNNSTISSLNLPVGQRDGTRGRGFYANRGELYPRITINNEEPARKLTIDKCCYVLEEAAKEGSEQKVNLVFNFISTSFGTLSVNKSEEMIKIMHASNRIGCRIPKYLAEKVCGVIIECDSGFVSNQYSAYYVATLLLCSENIDEDMAGTAFASVLHRNKFCRGNFKAYASCAVESSMVDCRHAVPNIPQFIRAMINASIDVDVIANVAALAFALLIRRPSLLDNTLAREATDYITGFFATNLIANPMEIAHGVFDVLRAYAYAYQPERACSQKIASEMISKVFLSPENVDACALFLESGLREDADAKSRTEAMSFVRISEEFYSNENGETSLGLGVYGLRTVEVCGFNAVDVITALANIVARVIELTGDGDHIEGPIGEGLTRITRVIILNLQILDDKLKRKLFQPMEALYIHRFAKNCLHSQIYDLVFQTTKDPVLHAQYQQIFS
ncbi:MAG: hypothetical protein LBR91_01780 [Puniceicoccales bacterium]|jgi:hypothetical protein|nr:hypothetical protein [Puniceicoccales bacterium]